jgi:hypothetical protein
MIHGDYVPIRGADMAIRTLSRVMTAGSLMAAGAIFIISMLYRFHI